jgi:xanthine dehydrogenase small subunit
VIRFLLNDTSVELERPAGELLLDTLRGPLRRTGVKQGCREGDCGACAVLIGELSGERLSYRAMPSCMMLLGHVEGRHVVTVEGLNPPAGLTPVQRVVAEEGATQCGFCTPGVVISLTSTLFGSTTASEAELLESAGGNICRCTGYMSFRRAARRLAADFGERPQDPVARLRELIQAGVIPPHFESAPAKLRKLRGASEGGDQPAGTTSSSADYGIAGGTDALVQRRVATHIDTPHFHHRPQGIDLIKMESGDCVLDASTTFEDLKRSETWRTIDSRAVRNMDLVASQLIRERATLGGNISNASPIADGVICLLALGTELELQGPTGSRQLPLAEFFLGYKLTALEEGEIIRRLRIPGGRRLRGFEKVSRRERLDIATVNSAACFELSGANFEGVTLSAGGVGPTPMLLKGAAAHLEGAAATPDRLRGALEIAQSEVQPISDVRGTAEYKRLLLRQLVLAHFVEALPDHGFEELCL